MYYFFNFTFILNVLLFLFENVCVLPKERRKDRKKKINMGENVIYFKLFMVYKVHPK